MTSKTSIRLITTILAAVVACLPVVAAKADPPAGSSPATSSSAVSPPRANPFAAHNAYPWRLYTPDRFGRALAAGLKHIEVDITYDLAREAVVATHDAKPSGNEPELGEFLEPLWKQWSNASDDGYTLILDFKSSSEAIARGVSTILESHADVLSHMPKRDGGKFQPGKITVCLTGNTSAHRIYADLLSNDQSYLAFGDGSSGTWAQDVGQYVPSAPPGFVRFLTYPYRLFLDAPDARGLDHGSLERLRKTVQLAEATGYRMRIYTINPPRRDDGSRDKQFWELCVEAGVHMISTDAYELAESWWDTQQYEP